MNTSTPRPYERPPPHRRPATSAAVESAIERVGQIARADVAAVFERALPMTLDTAVTVRDFAGEPDTFLLTGDIPAMWPRDATNAVWAYLPMLRHDATVARVVEGVLRREVACIRFDPYANAFYDIRFGPSERDRTNPKFGKHAGDRTEMRPEIHERKYELDTLAAVLRLSVGYDEAGGDPSAFDGDWLDAIRVIVRVIRQQQAGSDEEDDQPEGPPYSFQRMTPQASDTLVLHGRGQPARRCGLSKCHFRPSDDATHLPFHVPSNAMAAVGLRGVADILQRHDLDADLAQQCAVLADEITAAIHAHAVIDHPTAGRIFAYEVDGFGNAYCMDDANVPSLLSLAYLGFCELDDPLYQRTRAFVWSDDNPYFARGTAGMGIGGPHIGRANVWPMSILMHALTSDDDAEVDRALRTVCDTHGGRFVMHETFHKDDPARYTRGWFCWPNALFAELVLRLLSSKPHLLR